MITMRMKDKNQEDLEDDSDDDSDDSNDQEFQVAGSNWRISFALLNSP